MGKKFTTEEFIERSQNIHGNTYTYPEVAYTGVHNKVIITCKEHGEFLQTPGNHLSGKGCPTCGRRNRRDKKKLSLGGVLCKASLVHSSRYDYSKVDYINSTTKVIIICKEHGEFLQTPASHLCGSGCPTCGNERSKASRTLLTSEVIKRAKEIHENRYTYPNVKYTGATTKILVTCRVHGDFQQAPHSHLSGSGCLECHYDNKARGENNYFYKHGKAVGHRKERNSPEYRQWLKAIKTDKTTCDCCYEPFDEVTIPHAHHLNSWINNPEQRFISQNGVAVCEECRWEFHEAYGYGYNTKEQYIQFKQIKEMER